MFADDVVIGIRGNTATIHGYETGELTVVENSQKALVLRESGHRVWAQRPPGPTHRYEPAKFRVYGPEKEDGRRDLITAIYIRTAQERD